MSCLCFPQFCSTRAELVIVHTMTSAADLDRPRIIGVNLPAFLLSKNVCPDPVRGSWKFEIQSLKFENSKNQNQIKKPGVERRAKSRSLRDSARSSTYL